MNSRLTAMLTMAGLLCAQGSAFAAIPPQPITTNKTRFRIPFKIEPAALQRLNARELQLHVSRDGGVNWELAQTLAPDGAKFEYQSIGDGEYWFAVKTLDGRNQIHPPEGRYETGLIVQVDTAPPLLDLTLQQLAPGRVQLSWSAADAHLDPSSLKIEYQQPGTQEWEPVEVTPKSSGQIAWNVTQQGQVKVRGTIVDTATNVGKGQTQVQILAVGTPAPKPKPGRRVPIAEAEPSTEQAVIDRPVEESVPAVVSSMPGSRMPIARSNPPVVPIEEVTEYRGPVITPFGGSSIPAPSMGGAIERFTSDNVNSRPEITKDPYGEPEETAAFPSNPAPPLNSFPVANTVLPNSVSSNTVLPNTAPSNQMPMNTAPSNPAPRGTGQRRVVNSRRFQVGYTVDEVGPSGIGAVELFITQDQGRKWWKYGDDPDRRSPFEVEVPQDGEFGFSIRVRSGVGLTNDPPLPGETPSIVVTVDQTPPTVEVLTAQQGLGSRSNRVQVRWRIADEHLSSKPVSVYYSATRTGPWETISGWIDDQGGFEWTVAPGSPSQFYVRVVARDAAGNTGKAESPQPVLVDLARPTARIVDVETPQAVGPK